MTGDEYVEIDVEVKKVLPASVWVKYQGEEGNIARSLIHAADERHLDEAARGDELSLRVRAWKLNKLGWD